MGKLGPENETGINWCIIWGRESIEEAVSHWGRKKQRLTSLMLAALSMFGPRSLLEDAEL